MVGSLAITTNVIGTIPLVLLGFVPLVTVGTWAVDLLPTLASRLSGSDNTGISSKISEKLANVEQRNANKATLRSPIAGFFSELAFPYQGPLEATIAYLKEHSDPLDTVSSDCDAVSIAFHTGLKIRHMSLRDESLRGDWVVLRPHHFYATHSGWWIRNFYDKVLAASHDRIPLGAPDLPTLFYHLPDPNLHMYELGNENYPQMYIFRKKTSQ